MAPVIWLLLDLDRFDPIVGRLIGPDGSSGRFAGWLELMSKIDAFERANRPPDGPDSSGLDASAEDELG